MELNRERSLPRRMPYSYKPGASRTRVAHRLFFQESIRTIRVTASVLPSSRFLTTAMLEGVDFRKACTIVELGSGTGVITHEILQRMSADSHLFALEINRNFVRHLRVHCQDRRLTLLQADAADLLRQLRAYQAGPVDAVVSSLGLTGMKPDQRARILQAVESCLAPAGVLTQYQYLAPQALVRKVETSQMRRFQERKFLKNYFPDVNAKRVLLNFPPAVVFTCRK